MASTDWRSRLPPLSSGFHERYELLAPLGEGGMGMVLRARQRSLERDVAIKLLKTLDPEQQNRFQRESAALAQLSHPHILKVFDWGHDGSIPYLVCELAPGRTVEERRTLRPIALRQTLSICAQVAQALAYVHRFGIVHRDVKPANIFLDADGTARLGDFGLARSESEGSTLTAEGMILGTPDFLAPEQVRGERAGPATDQYALGVTLFLLLTGRLPFDGDSVLQIARARLTTPAPSLADACEGLPRPLVELVDKMLALDPVARHAGCDVVAQKLEELVDVQATMSQRVRGPTPSRNQLAPTQVIGVPLAARRVSKGLRTFSAILLGFLLGYFLARESGPSRQHPPPEPEVLLQEARKEDKLFCRWERIAPQEAELAETRKLTAAQLVRLQRDTPMELGGDPRAWICWIRLGEWLSNPHKTQHFYELYPGRRDATYPEQLIYHNMLSVLGHWSEVRLFSYLIRFLLMDASSPNVWLLLGTALEGDGLDELARKAYREGLYLAKSPNKLAGKSLVWRAFIRAVLLVDPARLNEAVQVAGNWSDPVEAYASLSILVSDRPTELVDRFLTRIEEAWPAFKNIHYLHGTLLWGRKDAWELALKAWGDPLASTTPDVQKGFETVMHNLLRQGRLDRADALVRRLRNGPLSAIVDLLKAAADGADPAAFRSPVKHPQIVRMQIFQLLEQDRVEEGGRWLEQLRNGGLGNPEAQSAAFWDGPYLELVPLLIGAGADYPQAQTDLAQLLDLKQPAAKKAPWGIWECAAGGFSLGVKAPYFPYILNFGTRFMAQESLREVLRALWASRQGLYENALDALELAVEYPWDDSIPGVAPLEVFLRPLLELPADTPRRKELLERIRSMVWPPFSRPLRELMQLLLSNQLNSFEQKAAARFEETQQPWFGLAALRAARATGKPAEEWAARLAAATRYEARSLWVMRDLKAIMNAPVGRPQ
jgi:serine/threonine protein kinase